MEYCGRGPVGGGITVVAKEDYDNILKDAEKTVNNICNKADIRKKWIEGLPIENKDIKNKDIKNMCGNFCDLTEKCIIKNSGCGSLNNPNVRPGPNYEWIATCGGGGRWEEVPDKEYWENYKKQYDKDPKSTANVIEKEDFNKLMKEAEETVNNINFKSDNAVDESNCKSKTSFDIYDRNANPGDDWEWNSGGCGAWDKGKWELKPQWKRFRDQTEKDPKSTATVIEKEEFDKLMKEAEETVNSINFKSDSIANNLKTCENEGCKFCQFGPKQCERFEAFDLMLGPLNCKHWQNKYSSEKYDKTPTTVSIEDAKKAEKEANKELENIEQAKDIEKQTIEHLQKGSANVIRRTYEKVAKGVGLNESYEEYMDRVHGKTVEDTKEASDTSYKHMTDEEILEQLKKNAVDNIMAKLSGQVIDLVDDAMRTAMLEFERSKDIRDAYEDACSQSNQAITDWKKEREAMEKPDFVHQYPHKWSFEIKNELGMRDKPDFMNQWVNEMMEKQAKQTNISVVNEMLHQKDQFIKFLKECLKLDTYSDFMYKIENEIKSQENEINFYNSYLEQFYKNN